MWHRLQEIYAEDLPALPLYFRPTRTSGRSGSRA